MSNTVLNAVFERSQSRGMDRLVLLVLADRADDSGATWCGTEDIARRAGIARQHVVRHTRKLVELGELEIGFRAGKNKVNQYRILACPTMGLSQGGTVPPRFAGCPTMVQNPSHHGTQTPRTPINPKGAKRERFDAGAVELPFSSKQFSEAWQLWVQHRKEKRQALTPTATKQQLAKLASIGEARSITAIDHSISSSYQGIFEPKGAPAEKPRFTPIGQPLNEAARRQVSAKGIRNPL